MSKVIRQANEHNSDMRNVHYEYSYSFNRFIERSEGNILINGGEKDKRRKCLLEYIMYMSRCTTRPLIIFSDDDILEDALIALAQGGHIGQLNICSERYQKYDFFCGMQNRFISECFTRIAAARGCKDTTEAQSYINAFLSIMREGLKANKLDGPDLNSMLSSASFSDKQIRAEAQNALTGTVIESSTKGGILLRSLLQVFAEETDSIRNKTDGTPCREADSITIKNCVNKGQIMLVKVPAVNCEIFAVYFASELRSLMDRDFVCIFDDSFMLDTDAMQTVVSMLKKRAGVDVVIACDNIVAFDDVSDRDMTVNFNSSIILLNGKTPQQDLQKILSSFGQYTHMKAMKNKVTPPSVLFTLERGEGESAQSYTRDRILLQEESGKEAVITCGSNAEIIIADKLLNNI